MIPINAFFIPRPPMRSPGSSTINLRWGPGRSFSRNRMDALRARIRDVPDFPKKGIIFKDITPVLEDGALFHEVIRAMAETWRARGIDKVAGIESRGFIFGAALSYELGAGFAIIPNLAKLPYRTIQQHYSLEYRAPTLNLH